LSWHRTLYLRVPHPLLLLLSTPRPLGYQPTSQRWWKNCRGDDPWQQNGETFRRKAEHLVPGKKAG